MACVPPIENPASTMRPDVDRRRALHLVDVDVELARGALAVVPGVCVGRHADLAGLRHGHDPSGVGERGPLRRRQARVAVVPVERDEQRIAERVGEIVRYREGEMRARRGGVGRIARLRTRDEIDEPRLVSQAREAAIFHEPDPAITAAFGERAFERFDRFGRAASLSMVARLEKQREPALQRIGAKALQIDHPTDSGLRAEGRSVGLVAQRRSIGQATFRRGNRPPNERRGR
jgi:hypothetical protein